MTGSNSDGRLKAHVDALTRIEEQKREVAKAYSDRMRLVKDDGYEAGIVKSILKERFRTQEDRDRDEAERKRKRAVLELYLADIGMLDGTPFGEHTRRELDKAMRKFQGRPPEPTPEEIEKEEQESLAEQASLPPEETLEDAWKRGFEAGEAGRPVMSNPYGPHDPKRSEWDTGWFKGSGKTGFEIPEDLQKSKKEKKNKKPPGGGSGGGDIDESMDEAA